MSKDLKPKVFVNDFFQSVSYMTILINIGTTVYTSISNKYLGNATKYK